MLACTAIISSASTKNEKTDEIDCCYSATGTYSYLKSTQTHFDTSEVITVEYGINSDSVIEELEYAATDATVTNLAVNEDEKSFTLEFNCSGNTADHLVEIRAILADSNTVYAYVYAFCNDYGCFISPFSYDDAREKYYAYALAEGILTEYDCWNLRNERSTAEKTITASNVNVINTMSVSDEATITVHGELEWEDDNGNPHDLRRVKVAVIDKYLISEITLCEGYADNYGYYSLSFPAKEAYGTDVLVRVYAITPAGTVYTGGTALPSFDDTSILDDITDSNSIKCDMKFDMMCDKGKRFQISQAILTAYDFAQSMIGEAPDGVSVYYPYGDTPCYKSSHIRIEITGNGGTHSTLRSYSSWDMIMHEYGHHIQCQIGIIDSPGGHHSVHINSADETDGYGNLMRTKDDAIGLAWSEAWATVFSIMAQHHQSTYMTDIVSVYDSSTGKIDTIYDSYSFYSTVNLNIDSITYRIGEACEGSIMGVLWDIYDSGTESNDFISLGYDGFWHVTTASGAKTFSEFVDYFYQTYPTKITDLGENLTYYKMASGTPTFPEYPSIEYTPTITWQKQGGSNTYPNNQFQVIFYDAFYHEIYRTPTTSNNTYTLTREEWDTVLYSNYNNFYVAVAAVQTDYPTTGEYISAATARTKPTTTDVTDIFILQDNDKYHESTYRLMPGQVVEVTLDVRYTVSRLMQTFGDADVKMTLYQAVNPTIVPRSDDDSGYRLNALINSTLEAGKQYMLRIEMCDPNVSGTFKLTITPARALTEDGDAYINSYEEIKALSDTGTTGVGFALSTPQTQVATFTASTSGTYTFTVSSPKFYCHVYVLDPRSIDTVVYGEDLKSAVGGIMDVSLDVELDAGIPYLVIMSPEAPSLVNGLNYGSLDVIKKED